jgi:hypothetical protein
LKQEEKKYGEIGLKLEMKERYLCRESKAIPELRKWDFSWRKGREMIKTKRKLASFKGEKKC